MTIRAIPQTYRGVNFQSTLEADWAATLDQYKVVWQYEPEGVILPSGTYYRPDFYLPEIRTWLEIKGPHAERIEKPQELRWAVAHSPECQTRDLGSGCTNDRHHTYRDPWRMVVIGGPAVNNNRLRAYVPGVSTVEADCSVCHKTQWTTWFTDALCRYCEAEDTLNEWAHHCESPPRSGKLASGLVLHRVPRAVYS